MQVILKPIALIHLVKHNILNLILFVFNFEYTNPSNTSSLNFLVENPFVAHYLSLTFDKELTKGLQLGSIKRL